MKRSYERPTCGIVKTMVEMSLLAGSDNGVTKNDPNHGGEDNLSKLSLIHISEPTRPY